MIMRAYSSGLMEHSRILFYSHTLCQGDLVGGHTAGGGKKAHRATYKDLQEEVLHLLGGETAAEVHYWGISVEKGMLLQ